MSFGFFAKEYTTKHKKELEFLELLNDYLVKNNDVSAVYYEFTDRINSKAYDEAKELIDKLEMSKKEYEHSRLTKEEKFDLNILEQVIKYCKKQYKSKLK